MRIPESVANVARALLQTQAEEFTIQSKPIGKGHSNLGCFLYTATSSNPAHLVSFVEKRTKHPSEVKFAKEVAPSLASDASLLLPEIYHVEDHFNYSSIFMEFLEGVGTRFYPGYDAIYLANCIAQIRHIPAEKPLLILDKHRSRSKNFTKYAQVDGFIEDEETRKQSIKVEDTIETLFEKARAELPVFASHNDLYFGNIAYRILNGRPNIRFIDWGLFGSNFAGAEFHHFVSAGLKDETIAKFSRQLIKHYVTFVNCKGTLLSEKETKFGALYYALVRSVFRYTGLRRQHDFKHTLRILQEIDKLLEPTMKVDEKSKEPVGDVYYGLTARNYEQKRASTKRWNRENRAISSLLEKMEDGLSVLDIPFGTGRFVPFYQRKHMKVTGVDISHDMLAAAKASLGNMAAACTLQVGNALKLDFLDRSFDLVVCVRFLQNIVSFQEATIAIGELARVTRKYVILELEIRRDAAPNIGKPKSNEPMRGHLYQSDLIELLHPLALSIDSVLQVYNNGDSDYSIILCQKQ